MQVTKRSGTKEAVSFDKILHAVSKHCGDLKRVDSVVVAKKAINGMFDGITTRALDEICARACADAVLQEPEYGVLGARILFDITGEDVKGQGVMGLKDSLRRGTELGLVEIWNGYEAGLDRLLPHTNSQDEFDTFCALVDASPEPAMKVFGAYTVVERYLLKHPGTRLPIETPKQWLARVALGNSRTLADATRQWQMMMSLAYLPSTPTLFNSGTTKPQMSSCFLMDSAEDSLTGIMRTIGKSAELGKFSGGIAGVYTGIRGLDSLIRGTNGKSNGIVPWVMIDNAAVAAVNQGGKRLGAKAIYLETWHVDINDFLDLHSQDGDNSRRARNLNLSNWIPDEFMRRAEADQEWSLFDPGDKEAALLSELSGRDFDMYYRGLETRPDLVKRKVSARTLFKKMMRVLSETGNGWICFKDRSNYLCNQTRGGAVVHSSNLCVAPETMILTRDGHKQIVDMCDKEVQIWNGSQWSNVTVKKTGSDVELVRVRLSNGTEIECTHEHKFATAVGRGAEWTLTPAHALNIGDRLAKFTMPVIKEGNGSNQALAYAHGFFCGDGTYEASGRPRTALYDEKKKLVAHLDLDHTAKEDGSGRINVWYTDTKLPPKFWVPMSLDIEHRLRWLEGVIDSDGCVARNGDNESLQIASVNRDFLVNIRLMLTTMGVDAKVTKMEDAGHEWMPDGKGGKALFPTQTIYRLLITSYDTWRLHELGLRPKRCVLAGAKPQRDARQFVTVVSVEQTGRISDTYCFTDPIHHLGTFNGVVTGQCTEILEVTKKDEWVAVCNLASMNAVNYCRPALFAHASGGFFDFKKFGEDVEFVVKQLDVVIDRNFYTIPETKSSNLYWRPVGLGLMGLTDAFHELGLVYGDEESRLLNARIFEVMYFHALRASCDQAREFGKCPAWEQTWTSTGQLHFERWGAKPVAISRAEWDTLKADIAKYGLRNSLLIAVAPTATIALIAGVSECTESMQQLAIRRETMSGDFLQVCEYMVRELQALGLWTDDVIAQFKAGNGSIQAIEAVPQELKDRFKTAFEIKQRTIIDMAVDRAPWIDQSQSLNLFIADPKIDTLSSMYFHAWKSGLKTTYYLRRRPPSEITKTSSTAPMVATMPSGEEVKVTASEGAACPVDGSCESCQ